MKTARMLSSSNTIRTVANSLPALTGILAHPPINQVLPTVDKVS